MRIHSTNYWESTSQTSLKWNKRRNRFLKWSTSYVHRLYSPYRSLDSRIFGMLGEHVSKWTYTILYALWRGMMTDQILAKIADICVKDPWCVRTRMHHLYKSSESVKAVINRWKVTVLEARAVLRCFLIIRELSRILRSSRLQAGE